MTLILSGTDGLSDVDGSAATPAIRGTDANTGIFFPAADTIAFSEGGAEVARFDSSGRLGIGATSPSGKLVVVGGNANTAILDNDNSQYTQLLLQRNSTANTGGDLLIDGTNATMSLRMLAVGAMRFCTSTSVGDGTERMRIDSSGNLLVGTTSSNGRLTVDATALGGSNQGVWAKNSGGASATFIAWNAVTTGNPVFVDFYTETSATQRGTISYNRGTGLVAYNTTSDYRAKNISGPVTDGLQTVAELKPYMGTMKGATVERPMFVAHEAQVTAPYCVTGEKDAVNEQGDPIYQQMDHASLVPLLVAAIQEQQAIITQLQADVAALKGNA